MTTDLTKSARGNTARPDWDTYFLGIARAVAARADCTRRRVGCVIVDEDHRILATGYNGSPPGGASCLKGDCPRGRHFQSAMGPEECICGADWPCEEAVPPGSSYDTGPGACVSIHAEANALLFARASVKGATLYCTDAPCGGCARLIQGAGIARVVVPS
jgi:dCMP deaminase